MSSTEKLHGLIPLLQHRLPRYLRRQRWYPAKDAGEPEVALASWRSITAEGLDAAIATWVATPPNQNSLLVCVPIAVAAGVRTAHADPICDVPGGDTELIDALGSDDFVRALVAVMLADEPQLPDVLSAAPDGWPIRRSTAEQSNTSIRIGAGAILKVFRTLVPGVHPELEMGRFLTPRLPPKAVPALLGSLEFNGCTLAVLQSFVNNEGDGWQWMLGRLRVGAFDEATRWIRTLGRRTAEMHLALAAPSDDPAFSPEMATGEDWSGWITAMEERMGRVSEALRRASEAGDADAADHRAFERTQSYRGRLAALTPQEPMAKTRLHGDFHLGQVLVRGDDLTIVDFEGEPLRPLEERRAKSVALRDVAGMLRSFDYAAATVSRDSVATQPAASFPTEESLMRWLSDASACYVQSYRLALEQGGCRANPSDAQRALRFFMIEKALYEVLYELANRPPWVGIPLKALVGLLGELAPRACRPESLQRSPVR